MEQFLFNLAAPVLTGVLGLMSWFLKGAVDRVTQLEEKYNSLHEYYVKRDDFHDLKKDMKDGFARIEDKLDKLGK